MMSAVTPLLATKLYIPRVRPSLVSRPGLTMRLNEGLTFPVTLISAPAGFGKTTLLSEWIPTSECCVAWVALDEGDNDPTRFWTYFIAALQTLRDDLAQDALAWLQAPQPPPLESILTRVLNDIAGFPDAFTLVLDDYHVIESESIHRGLAFLIEHVPPRMNLVITSRADPPLPLARLRANGQLTEIRADDLRFTPDEAAALLNQIMSLALSVEDVAALRVRTEGWVAGLHLVALSMQGCDAEAQRNFIEAFTGSHHYVLDYLTEEVLTRQSESVQRFLLHTSILDRLSGLLCDAVTGQTDGQKMLEYLEHANLFLTPLDAEQRWYRYHQLFADVLRHRLRQEQPELMAELHRRASAWYEQNGSVAEAVQHALAAKDFERTAHLIEAVYRMMLSRSEVTTLLKWVEALPVELARSRPRLCLAKAWSLLYTDRLDETEACLEDAERTLHPSPASEHDAVEHTGLLGEVAALRANLAVIRDDAPRSIEFAEQALKFLPAEQGFLRGMINANLGAAYCSTGNLPAARQALDEALHLGHAVGNLLLIYRAHFGLAEVETLEGKLHRAAEIMRQALQMATTPAGTYLPMASMAHRLLGELLYEWNDLNAATHHTSLALELSHGWRARKKLIRGHVTLARAQEARGDNAAALAALQQAEQLAEEQHIPDLIALVAVSQLQRWIAQGHLGAAVRWMDTLSPLDETKERQALKTDGNLNPEQRREIMALARLLVVQGQSELAAGWLRPLLQSAEAMGFTPWLIETLVLQALAFHAEDDRAAAMTALERALLLAEPEGYIRTFVDEGEPMLTLLRAALSDLRGTPLVAYVDTLLLACAQERPRPAASRRGVESWPLVEPLSPQEQRVLRLLAAGLSNPEIARELVVSINTIKTQVKSIYGKLNVTSREEASEAARQLNLL